MLPVQTVMIRYMVLVYRWGNGWLGAAGDWEDFVGGAVTGGGARRRVPLTGPGRARVRKGPADEGPAGPMFILYWCGLIVTLSCFEGFLGSKSLQPLGMVNVPVLDNVWSSRGNELPSGFVSIL